MTQKEIINSTLDKLTGHYAYKVMVYALTLLEIQEEQNLHHEPTD